MARRLILLSGMGGDGRLFRGLRVPGAELVAPDHVMPSAHETLSDYAVRVEHDLRVEAGDVIGGASFGGMVAAQIASTRPVAGLVLLGTCHRVRLLPRAYRLLEIAGRFVPDVFLNARTLAPLIRLRFGPMDRASQDLLCDMAAAMPAVMIRRFAQMCVGWRGVETFTCPVLSVHGARDRVLPMRCAAPDVILEDAGHAFTLTHAAQTSAAIARFLAGLDGAKNPD